MTDMAALMATVGAASAAAAGALLATQADWLTQALAALQAAG